jgi:hypothetical protein
MADSQDRWTVRGVPVTAQRRASKAAKAGGITLGKWLTQTIEAATGGRPAASVPASMADVERLERRLEVVEARMAQAGATNAAMVEDGGEAVDAPDGMKAAEPEPAAEGLSDGKQRRPWTAEDDAALRRIAAEGGTQADAMRKLQRTSSTINSKWKSLGLPVEPRKGRVLGPRRKLTA